MLYIFHVLSMQLRIDVQLTLTVLCLLVLVLASPLKWAKSKYLYQIYIDALL